MSRVWKITGRAAFLAAFLLLFAWGLQNIQQAGLLSRGWSLRYDEGFGEVQKQQAKRYFIEHRDGYKGLWVDFWAEGKGSFTAEFRGADADVLYFDGDASRVKAERFLTGGYPGELDTRGIAVSAELSWQLWGSLDTVGKEVRVGGKTKVVCGVYEGKTAAAMLCGDRDTKWHNAEVSADGALSREELIQFLSASLIGEPDALVDGEGIAGLLQLLQYLPVLAAFVFVVVRLLRMNCRGYGKNIRRGAVLLALFAFALLLPQLLQYLPPWLLPTKWSDLTFWSGLFETLSGYMRDWFALKPAGRDVLLKQCMLLQGLYAAGMLFCLIGVFRGSRRLPQALPSGTQSLRAASEAGREGSNGLMALRG